MKLLLHIGTEKTASSYLQHVCSRSRDFLLNEGIYFPAAGRDERRMRKGLISPGNARELAQLIESQKWSAVSKWLHVRVRAGEENSCDHLLLSHELLYAAFARDKSVTKFEVAAAQANVTKIAAMLMIRDPVDQAISLFKHRAKNGLVGEIEDWICTSYSVPDDICSFLDQVAGSTLQFEVRKYEKKTDTLAKKFFQGWLKLRRLPNSVDVVVNPSLTLSELRLIKHIASTLPSAVPAIYSSLLAVPNNSKACDIGLEQSAHAIVTNHLSRFSHVWTRLDELLASEGGVEVPEPVSKSVISIMSYSFSNDQLLALANGLVQANSSRYRAEDWLLSTLRALFGKMRSKAGASLRKRWK